MSLALARRPRASSARSSRLLVALGAGAWLLGGCFDSDEKVQPAAEPSTTSGIVPETSSSSSTTSGSSSTTAEPEVTCRDAIECVFGCITELQTSMLPEPDLTCFLECEPGLTSEEVLNLFRLAECVTLQCIDLGVCEELVPTETSTGTSTSTGGESSGSSSSTGSIATNDCLNCVVGAMMDPEPPGCMEFAAACM